MSTRILEVRVKPNARGESFTEQPDGTWLATIKAPPVDGKANAALIALVAESLGVRKAQVSIKVGGGGRRKLVRIEG
jgi:uncharacterized protein (TIGR00251 family)